MFQSGEESVLLQGESGPRLEIGGADDEAGEIYLKDGAGTRRVRLNGWEGTLTLYDARRSAGCRRSSRTGIRMNWPTPRSTTSCPIPARQRHWSA